MMLPVFGGQKLPFSFITFLHFLPLILQNPGSVSSATSKLSPLPHEPYDRGATIDIPLDSSKVDWIMKILK